MSAGRSVNTKSKDWNTPAKYVDAIREFFGGSISLDPCSNDTSIVGAETEFKLPNQDGLKEDWKGFPTIFVNPPYGRDKKRGTSIADWLKKCADARDLGAEVVALVPVATNTEHWKKSVFGRADAVCFLADTRLKFMEGGEESKKGAPMACALVYWGVRPSTFIQTFSKFGAAISLVELKSSIDERDIDDQIRKIMEAAALNPKFPDHWIRVNYCMVLGCNKCLVCKPIPPDGWTYGDCRAAALQNAIELAQKRGIPVPNQLKED